VWGRRLRDHFAADDLCFGLRPGSQHLILLPEEWRTQDDAQRAQDEISNPEQRQDAVFFAGQARTMKIVFTTESQRAQSESFKRRSSCGRVEFAAKGGCWLQQAAEKAGTADPSRAEARS
jgi:hypothetical protein